MLKGKSIKKVGSVKKRDKRSTGGGVHLVVKGKKVVNGAQRGERQ